MPKGSFFLDETKADWTFNTPYGGSSPGIKAPATPQADKETTLFAPAGATTWAVSGPDDAACVATMKALFAKKPPKIEEDALFKRKGLVAAGYLSSLVGAFAMHRLSLKLGGLGGLGGGAVPSSALADVERDLATPRMALPFVLTSQPRADGGVVTFEIRGERDAFLVLGEHLGSVLGGGMTVFMALALLGAMGAGLP
jgi:hypothetical protein